MPSTPETIGRYRVTRRIGSGGMGVLYEATDPAIDRTVAIKVLRANSEDLVARFIREARTVGRLNHPNIVTIFDVGEEGGQPFIAMEYVPGETLAALIARQEPRSIARRLELTEELCNGLAYAHANGIVHRDVKPANIMVADSGALKILDFGIARAADLGMTMTESGVAIGTLAYMAPEQVRGDPPDYRCDIFSVGLVLYELLIFRKAFPSANPQVLMQQRLLQKMPTSLVELEPTIDPKLVGIVDRALAADPTARYQNLTQLGRELARVRRQLPPEPSDETVWQPRPGITEPVSTPSSGGSSAGPDLAAAARKRREEQLQRDLRSAAEALARGDLEAAQQAAEQAAFLDPDDKRVETLFAQLTAGRQARRVKELLAAAEQQLKAEELDEALNSVDEALGIQPGSAEGAGLKRRIRRALVVRQRAEAQLAAVRQALERANAKFQERDMDAVIQAVSEVLAYDPEQEEALQLRGAALAAIEEEERRLAQERRASAAVAEARRLRGAGQLEPALELLQGFEPQLPSVAELREELETAVAARRRLQSLIQDASARLAAGELAEARQAAEEALRLDSLNSEAARISEVVDQKLAEQERERRAADARRQYLATQLERARRALAGERPEAALKTLQALRREGFEEGDVSSLVEQAETMLASSRSRAEEEASNAEARKAEEETRRAEEEARRAEERAARKAGDVAAALDRTRVHLEAAQLDAAREAAEEAIGHDPANAEAQTLLVDIQAMQSAAQEASLRQAAEAAVDKARRTFAGGDPAAALTLLDGFSPQHPLVDRALEELRQQVEVQRRELQKRLANEVGQAIDGHRFDDAEALLRDLQTAGASSDDVTSSRTRLTEARQRLERIEALLAEADEQAAREDYASALVSVRQVLDLDSAEPRATGRRERFEAEERRLAEEREHARQAKVTVAEAEKTFSQGLRGEALARLERFAPPHEVVSEALARLKAEAARLEQEEREQAERLEAGLRQARAALEQESFDDALRVLDRIRPIRPELPELKELQDRARSGLEAVEAARRQREQMERTLTNVRAFLDEDQLDDVPGLLDTVLSVEPQEARAIALRRELAERQERRNAAAAAVREARTAFARGEQPVALQGLEQFTPAHPLVDEALAELRSEYETLERQRQRAEARARRVAQLKAVAGTPRVWVSVAAVGLAALGVTLVLQYRSSPTPPEEGLTDPSARVAETSAPGQSASNLPGPGEPPVPNDPPAAQGGDGSANPTTGQPGPSSPVDARGRGAGGQTAAGGSAPREQSPPTEPAAEVRTEPARQVPAGRPEAVLAQQSFDAALAAPLTAASGAVIDVATWAPESFGRARALGDTARGQFSKGQFVPARTSYQGAGDALDAARQEAAGAYRAAAAQVDTARTALAAVRGTSVQDAAAVQEAQNADRLAKEGDLRGAAAAYDRSADLFGQANQRELASVRASMARQRDGLPDVEALGGARDLEQQGEGLVARGRIGEGVEVLARAVAAYQGIAGDVQSIRQAVARLEEAYRGQDCGAFREVYPSGAEQTCAQLQQIQEVEQFEVAISAFDIPKGDGRASLAVRIDYQFRGTGGGGDSRQGRPATINLDKVQDRWVITDLEYR